MKRPWILLLAGALALALPATAAAQDDEEDLEDLEDEEDLEEDLEEPAADEEDLEEESVFGGEAMGGGQAALGEPDEELDRTFIDKGRFFADEPETEASREETLVRGSLTSSSMYFRELGVELPEPEGGSNTGPGATSIERLFTDLRAQLHAEHIGGSGWDFKGDARGRYAPNSCNVDEVNEANPCLRTQTGTFGGEELEVRELFLARRSDSLELYAGRQYVLDLAAHRLDGLQLRYKSSPRITYLGFAGLHPQKASRDIRQDYPKSLAQTDGGEKRIMPVTGGAGLAYRFERLYGALGGVVVAPLVEESEMLGGDGRLEQPRVFLTTNGYFRQSATFDVYHYGVLDVAGSAALSLTNVTVGLNYRPSPRLRTYLQLNRVDTESLTALIQTKLDAPNQDDIGGTADLDAIQNNIEVLRVAQDSVRAGVSGALSQRRYELSTSVALRRRDEVTLTSPDGSNSFTLPAAQDLEALVRMIDRRSLGGYRIGAQVSKSFPVGAATFQRSTTLIGKLDARKELASGKGELEIYALGVQSDTESGADEMSVCVLNSSPEQLEDCYSPTSARTLSGGAVLFYRVSDKVMAVANGSFGVQKVETEVLDQGTMYPISLFLRLAYRL